MQFSRCHAEKHQPDMRRFARITSSTRITATRSISGIMHESSRPSCAIRANRNLPEELTFPAYHLPNERYASSYPLFSAVCE